MYAKIDRTKQLGAAVRLIKAGAAPCSICKHRLGPDCIEDLLAILQAAERRDREIRHARRVGNLIEFPKLTSCASDAPPYSADSRTQPAPAN